ncbi:hypothetical protein sphantq_04554 (plasmid) [Sphingobium sp. AntQ-1]|uniref:DsrE family protein n=1 Tax=Sphingobium sp. AntQ-1 TaxID=2930091 RepID=UPI0027AB182C|nr:hypothetical protein sphantq_04554 [Sphingobium sp. AntQ-1]
MASRLKKLFMVATSCALAASSAALAAPEPAIHPLVQTFGAVHPVQGAQERPDPKLTYRVVFSVTKAAMTPDKINPSLEKVARFLNLLAADSVRPQRGNVVVVIHGPATPIVTTDAVYASHAKTTSNPNAALIAALEAAGVSVRVCSQAMVGNEVSSDQLLPGVEIDDAALVTMANLQLRGFALIPD